MDELYQLNPSSGISEEVKSCLEAGLARDINMMRVLIQLQLNDLSNAYTNIGALISVISPEKSEEFNTSTMFALQEVAHIINVTLGDEKEVSFDPKEANIDHQQM